MSNGTFKVRVTGREYNGATKKGAKRSLIATFKRSGFLKFVYFTDQENRDPQADSNASNRAAQQTNCVNRKRTARKDRGCVEIQFTDNDAINGPLHTNDESLLVCASPRFGREKLKDGSPGMTDSIEVSGPAPGYVANGSCTMTPKIFTPNGNKFSTNVETMDMPESNQELVGGRHRRRHGVLRQDDHPSQEQHDGRHQLRDRCRRHPDRRRVAGQRRALRHQQRLVQR